MFESDQGIPVMDDDALEWPTWRFEAASKGDKCSIFSDKKCCLEPMKSQ